MSSKPAKTPAITNVMRERIMSEPMVILEDHDLMRALISANERAMGGNIVDLRGIAMERLEALLARLEDTHRNVIAAAYENLSGTNQVHRAILRMLDPAEFANRCFGLLPPGGRLVITVPKSYPHHRDPIDTMFRPTPEEISALISEAHEVLVSEIIDTGSYRDNLKRRPWIIYRQILRLPFPFLGWTRWKRSMKKFYWMIWPYRQSCIVIQKPFSAGSEG